MSSSSNFVRALSDLLVGNAELVPLELWYDDPARGRHGEPGKLCHAQFGPCSQPYGGHVPRLGTVYVGDFHWSDEAGEYKREIWCSTRNEKAPCDRIFADDQRSADWLNRLLKSINPGTTRPTTEAPMANPAVPFQQRWAGNVANPRAAAQGGYPLDSAYGGLGPLLYKIGAIDEIGNLRPGVILAEVGGAVVVLWAAKKLL